MFKIRSILFLLLCTTVVLAVPPALNLYIIPFDNSKSDAPLNWLSDAFPEMIKTDLNNYDNVFEKRIRSRAHNVQQITFVAATPRY